MYDTVKLFVKLVVVVVVVVVLPVVNVVTCHGSGSGSSIGYS